MLDSIGFMLNPAPTHAIAPKLASQENCRHKWNLQVRLLRGPDEIRSGRARDESVGNTRLNRPRPFESSFPPSWSICLTRSSQERTMTLPRPIYTFLILTSVRVSRADGREQAATVTKEEVTRVSQIHTVSDTRLRGWATTCSTTAISTALPPVRIPQTCSHHR